MEGGGGGGRRSVGGCGRPRTTLLDQMSSAVADGRDLAGLTLDDILAKEKRPVPAPPPAPAPPLVPAGRTLLDIIRDEDPKARTCKAYNGNRDKKCWKSFKERLRLKRSGAVWTSSVHIPTSDIIIPDNRSQFSRHNSVRRHTTAQLFADSPPHMSHPDDSSDVAAGGGGHDSRPQMSRRSSSRFTSHTSFRSDSTPDNNDDAFENSHGGSPAGPVPSLRPQMSRRVSSRISPAAEDNVADPTDPPREGSRRLSVVLAEERSLSAREAVAAQEAAEAEAAAAAIAAAEAEESEWAPVPDTSAAPETDAGQQVRMSLMDLLEETDRQMGFVGSRYTIGDAEEEVEEEEEEVVEEVVVGGVDQNCCVCMVRHKGAAFIPCGHTFCRLCSRELWVSRGNCPLCNGFILEILDIF
ncbi:hypothetical protein UlMin_031857 [Ulmus minor]